MALAIAFGVWPAICPAGGARASDSIPVLMYHHISDDPGQDVWTVGAEEFERQIRFLKEQGYQSILPDDWVAAARGETALPAKPILITFDDGLQSILTHVEPILKRHGFRAIVYVITRNLAETENDRRSYEGKPCLIWPEARALHERGVIAIGSHSHTHSKHPSVLEREMTISRRTARERAGLDLRHYCYPYGVHPPGLMKAAREAGYLTAMVCENTLSAAPDAQDPYGIPRVSVYGGHHEFHVKIVRAEQDPRAWVVEARNEGLPIPVQPVLVTGGRRAILPMEPGEKLGPRPRVWTVPAEGEPEPGEAHVELWDRHGVLKLHP
ncbi:MAG: polysaccharide deacetylase family protein [Kiritimatiellae bacterium]|nr:polysaccharide deacetylase family protein [Kiritimatiellia bacterium]